MAYSGLFSPSHPKKYKGDVNNIVYRSLWERAVMVRLDETPEVKVWSSEEIRIPYISIDGLRHTYYPDFFVEMTNGQKLILEIKPKKQCSEPKKRKSKKMSKAYLIELTEYGRNQCKWDAAEGFCKAKGWQFMVMTEEHPWLQVFDNRPK